MKTMLSRLALAAVMTLAVAAPMGASAQSLKDLEKLVSRRQSKKNEWRNIAIASGALSILGLLKKDNTLFFLGAAGALYSANRYEQDRKSQSKLQRTRAAYFAKPYFYRDGVRYNRKTVYKNGHKYYQFVKAKKA
jgi:hypothetical protein